MRLRRCLPGSLMPDGSIVDYAGVVQSTGPCWVPKGLGFGVPSKENPKARRRAQMVIDVGWKVVYARDYPSIPPRDNLTCVRREIVS